MSAIRAVSSLSRLKITAGNALHHLSEGFGAAAGPHVCQVALSKRYDTLVLLGPAPQAFLVTASCPRKATCSCSTSTNALWPM